MLEAEISPTGGVTVEGHHVGELQGFRFSADQAAAGEDAKAVRAAAQKALAAEFEARAERFSTAPNGDFALASDGILRWLGQPVAALTDGEDALKPRVILLADEQLTGPARDKVAARAERFVGFQIETLLKPLTDLRDAEALTGIARGVAFRLVENFGLINRRDIADDIKSLDQEARAALRRLGVRFGAYHIFLPALLKPAPAGLVTLLWALKHDGKDKPGFGDLVNALAAGRTSVVVEPSFDREFYKLAGFRILGRRAARVDILERVADLIRPALAWKPGAGPRPEGAFDGGAFLVTPQMMSVLGATAADMEEILKSLGYRSEAKLPAEIAARIAMIDADIAAKAAADAAAKAAQAAAEQPAEDMPADVIAAEVVEADAAETPVAETVEAPDSAEAPEAVAEAAVELVAEPAAEAAVEPVAEAVADVAGDSAAEAATDAAPAAADAEEPKPILVWRPVRFEGRPRHQNRRDGGAGDRQRGPRRQGRPQQEGEARDAGQRQPSGPRRDRNDRGEQVRRDQKGPRRDDDKRGPRPDRDRKPERRFEAKPREDKPARIDPDSPFAKLAALRDQLRK